MSIPGLYDAIHGPMSAKRAAKINRWAAIDETTKEGKMPTKKKKTTTTKSKAKKGTKTKAKNKRKPQKTYLAKLFGG